MIQYPIRTTAYDRPSVGTHTLQRIVKSLLLYGDGGAFVVGSTTRPEEAIGAGTIETISQKRKAGFWKLGRTIPKSHLAGMVEPVL